MEKLEAKLTPEQFEIAVQKIIASCGATLSNFKVTRREVLSSADGSYEVDVIARFEALGVSFLVLIECKHHRNPIKREVVQILNDRLRSLGAHKGILVSVSRFQSGAVHYAERHGIALILLLDQRLQYVRKAYHGTCGSVSGRYIANIAKLKLNAQGASRVTYKALSQDQGQSLLKIFGLVK